MADETETTEETTETPESLVTSEGEDTTSSDTDESLVTKGEEEKPAEETVAPVLAETITLPEGVEIAEETMTEFVGLLNDSELSRDDLAQKLVDLQLKQGELAETAQQEAWTEVQNEWQADAKALPEIGGAELPATLAGIKSGLDKLGANEETYAALDLTGAGNHPAIIKILHAATAHLKEGSPTADGKPPGGTLSQAERMFGTTS